MYAPYLPADEEGSATIDNYIRMLDKKYSLEPLIRALQVSEKKKMSYDEIPTSVVRQLSVRLFVLKFKHNLFLREKKKNYVHSYIRFTLIISLSLSPLR